MNKNTRKFFIGLFVVFFIIFFLFLYNYCTGKELNFAILFVVPLFFYLMIALITKINTAVGTNNNQEILKWLSLIIFGIGSLITLFNGYNDLDVVPLCVFVSILFNWNNKEGESNMNEKKQANSPLIIYYLIPFVILLFVYVIVAMLFYRYTNIEENKLKLIFLYGGFLVLEYWGVYLFYRYFLRKNKAAKILKIIFLFAFSFGIYTFAKSITQYSTTSLLLVDLSAVVSETAIDLLFSNHKITEKMETEECKDD